MRGGSGVRGRERRWRRGRRGEGKEGGERASRRRDERREVLTIHGVKELLDNELKELLLQPPLVDALLPLELHPELLAQVYRVEIGNGFQLE